MNSFLLLSSAIFAFITNLNCISCEDLANRIDLDTRIVGGHEVEVEVVPYQVALLVLLGGSRMRMICGGTIISSKFVLTAGELRK